MAGNTLTLLLQKHSPFLHSLLEHLKALIASVHGRLAVRSHGAAHFRLDTVPAADGEEGDAGERANKESVLDANSDTIILLVLAVLALIWFSGAAMSVLFGIVGTVVGNYLTYVIYTVGMPQQNRAAPLAA
jgi:hypothetical protein